MHLNDSNVQFSYPDEHGPRNLNFNQRNNEYQAREFERKFSKRRIDAKENEKVV